MGVPRGYGNGQAAITAIFRDSGMNDKVIIIGTYAAGKKEKMLLDARSLPHDAILSGDICIVGGGAAGIAMALEFVNSAYQVVLLESGGLEFKQAAQALYQGASTGRSIAPLEFTRRRQFGGTTNTWFGRCRPLDEIDFQERNWIAHSGWPISRSDLDTYYARAQRLLELDEYNYTASRWADDLSELRRIKSAGLETKVFQFSPPSNFGRLYLEQLERARNIQVYLSANAVRIALQPDGRSVASIQCMTLAENNFQVRAKSYVLAASALEATRLLLVSNDNHQSGIGNGHDLVGRFFMEHVSGFCGTIDKSSGTLPSSYFKLNYEVGQKNLGVTKAIGIPETKMREQGLLNAAAFFVKRATYKGQDAYYSRTMASLLEINQMLRHETKLAPLQLFRQTGRSIKSLHTILPILLRRISHAIEPSYSWGLQIQLETVPHLESRVTLSDRKDKLGVHQINVHWQTTRQDVENYRQVEELLYTGLQKLGFTTRRFAHELDSDGWPISMTASKHHMGTTRMHASPRQGVVDANCRVHGVDNLHIASSSVFPTAGMANPTLTILALAVRLADHIKSRLRS
jgi:choline dehydrogenase-like flavoprotein